MEPYAGCHPPFREHLNDSCCCPELHTIWVCRIWNRYQHFQFMARHLFATGCFDGFRISQQKFKCSFSPDHPLKNFIPQWRCSVSTMHVGLTQIIFFGPYHWTQLPKKAKKHVLPSLAVQWRTGRLKHWDEAGLEVFVLVPTTNHHHHHNNNNNHNNNHKEEMNNHLSPKFKPYSLNLLELWTFNLCFYFKHL